MIFPNITRDSERNASQTAWKMAKNDGDNNEKTIAVGLLETLTRVDGGREALAALRPWVILWGNVCNGSTALAAESLGVLTNLLQGWDQGIEIAMENKRAVSTAALWCTPPRAYHRSCHQVAEARSHYRSNRAPHKGHPCTPLSHPFIPLSSPFHTLSPPLHPEPPFPQLMRFLKELPWHPLISALRLYREMETCGGRTATVKASALLVQLLSKPLSDEAGGTKTDRDNQDRAKQQVLAAKGLPGLVALAKAQDIHTADLAARENAVACLHVLLKDAPADIHDAFIECGGVPVRLGLPAIAALLSCPVIPSCSF